MNTILKYILTIAALIMLNATAGAAAGSCPSWGDLSDMEQTMQTSPSADLLAQLAASYESVGWWSKSAQSWERYLREYPGGAEADTALAHAAMAHRWIGSEMFLTGAPAKDAVFHLKRAITLDPNGVDAYQWLVRVYISEGRFEDAFNELTAVRWVGLPISNFVSMVRDANISYRSEGIARGAMERGILLDDNSHGASALSVFRVAGELNPNDVFVHYWEGKIYMSQHRYAYAASEFQTFKNSMHHNYLDYRYAWLLENAQQDAGVPLNLLALYRNMPSLPAYSVASAPNSIPKSSAAASFEVCER